MESVRIISAVRKAFSRRNIELVAPLPLSMARVVRPYLLTRHAITDNGTVFVFAIPYYLPHSDTPERNVSLYATGRDYHYVIERLCEDIITELSKEAPELDFVWFSDHSPIDEISAAALCGLGIRGANGLLITEKYSSFVFLGGLFTSSALTSDVSEYQEEFCENCGKCKSFCPVSDICLSEITQKKGILTPQEADTIKNNGSVWGCDICQLVCPHTERAIKSGSIYAPDNIAAAFGEPIPYIDELVLDKMTDEEFSRRAYAWRGRDVILRNVRIINDRKSEDT